MGLFCMIDSKIDRSIGSKISTTNFAFCEKLNIVLTVGANISFWSESFVLFVTNTKTFVESCGPKKFGEMMLPIVSGQKQL